MYIYVDTNILCRLSTDIEYSKIYTILSENVEALNVVYSNAHLLDLKKDTTDIKYQDLEKIEKIAGKRYLCKYFKKPVMMYEISPTEAFNNLTDDKHVVTDIPVDIITTNPQIQESIFQLKRTLADLEIEKIDLSVLPTTLQKYLGTILKQKENFNFSEIIESGMDFYNELNENDESYKKLRGFILDNKSAIFSDPQTNAIDMNIDDLFSNSAFKMKFLEYIDDKNNKLNSDENDKQYERFVLAYNVLNSFGLDKEKNKKAKFSNTFIDSLHTYYASFCDLLITNDIGIKTKSSIIYKLFDIKTIVLNSHEFSRVEIKIQES